MMNVSASDARAMSLHEYEGRLYHWNEAHNPSEKVPDHEYTQKMIDKLNANPSLTQSVKS